jgi:regulator of replication initiation timing
MKQRQKRGQVSPKKKKSVESKDVTVEMFDAIIKQLQDMRQFFVATVAENNSLRAKLESLKKALS